MQKHKKEELTAKQIAWQEYPPAKDVGVIRPVIPDIVQSALQTAIESKDESLAAKCNFSTELPDIVKKAINSVDKSQNTVSNNPKLDIKQRTSCPRSTITLCIANQFYQVSADADVEYMKTIAQEANLLIKDVKRQLKNSDKQTILTLCLMNVLDEKADMTFKLREQEQVAADCLLINKELKDQVAVAERKIQQYKQKLTALAEVFSQIAERFSLYKNDPACGADNFRKIILQLLEGEKAEDQLSRREQITFSDLLRKE